MASAGGRIHSSRGSQGYSGVRRLPWALAAAHERVGAVQRGVHERDHLPSGQSARTNTAPQHPRLGLPAAPPPPPKPRRTPRAAPHRHRRQVGRHVGLQRHHGQQGRGHDTQPVAVRVAVIPVCGGGEHGDEDDWRQLVLRVQGGGGGAGARAGVVIPSGMDPAAARASGQAGKRASGQADLHRVGRTPRDAEVRDVDVVARRGAGTAAVRRVLGGRRWAQGRGLGPRSPSQRTRARRPKRMPPRSLKGRKRRTGRGGADRPGRRWSSGCTRCCRASR